MNTIIGLLFIAMGSAAQSSSYVPIKKIKDWAWECFWLIQGIFAWLIFPYLGTLLALPAGVSLGEILAVTDAGGSIVAWKVMGFGALWGVGGLTFGLSIRYLGVAMGQSLSLGTCSAFGTLIPVLLKGDNLFHGEGLTLLIGVSIAIAGIAVIGYAGSLRDKNMTEEEKRKAVKDFALKKGILIALLAGVMSACFNLGLEAGAPILSKAKSLGVKDLMALNPVILLVAIGGLCTNAVFCIYCNIKNKTGKQYFSVCRNILINNLLFCSLAGILWYLQVFGLGMGKSFLQDNPVMLAFSWSILMSLNILFSNIWGILLKEWKGVGWKTVTVLIIGLLILILSLVFPQI